MKPSIFHSKTVKWLRQSQSLSTSTRPGEVLETRQGGGAAVHGYFIQASRAANLMFSALYVGVLGTVLLMFHLPGLSPTASAAVRWTGYGANVAGVGCVAAAEVERRRKRTRAMVELRAADTVTDTSIGALAKDAGGSTAWLVTDGELSRETLARARREGVRCFALIADDFVEIDDDRRPGRAAPSARDPAA